ncbi:hypothetical protein GW915_02515 [bacterium]|nr:hypothetical protein [bacterium]
MWLAVVEKAKEFEALSAVFLKEDKKAFVKSDTPFGAPILMADSDESKPYPSFVLLDRAWPENGEALVWCYKNLQVDAFVSTGVVEVLTSAALETAEDCVYFPQNCLRSECNLDLLSGPLLYEEFRFDIKIQSELGALLAASPKVYMTSEKNIFSTTKVLENRKLKKLIQDDLNCFGMDDFTGELSSFCKGLNIPYGCLKVSSHIKKNAVSTLSRVWFDLFSAKAQGAFQK